MVGGDVWDSPIPILDQKEQENTHLILHPDCDSLSSSLSLWLCVVRHNFDEKMR